MCGIIGIVRNKEYALQKEIKSTFHQLIYADAVRGWDSTGVFLASKNTTGKGQESVYYKRALAAQDFLSTRGFGSIYKDLGNYDIMVGHNRAATQGAVTDENAHPFDTTKVIGVHNGTLTSKKVIDVNTSTVDSENIFLAMDKYPAQEVLEDLTGAFALAWYDKNTGNLFLARNKERPLTVSFVKNRNIIIISSEEDLAGWVAGRNGLHIEEVWDVEEGTINEINPSNPKEYTTTNFTVKKSTVYYSKPWKDSYRGGGDKNRYYKENTAEYKKGDKIRFKVYRSEKSAKENPTKHKSTGFSVTPGDSYPTVISFSEKPLEGGNIIYEGTVVYSTESSPDGYPTVYVNEPIKATSSRTDLIEVKEDKTATYVLGPSDKLITLEKWRELTSNGCSLCSKDLKLKDKIHWYPVDTGTTAPLCDECFIEVD